MKIVEAFVAYFSWVNGEFYGRALYVPVP